MLQQPPRLVTVVRHSVRLGLNTFDDPLDTVAGADGALKAAKVFVREVLDKQPPSICNRPFVVVSSPLDRCIATSLALVHGLQAEGCEVSGFLLANGLAEESYNLLRYRNARHATTITDLLPMQQVLKRTHARSSLARSLGLRYLRNAAGGHHDHDLHLRNTDATGASPRMLACVQWAASRFPGHNVVAVGHRHLVASKLKAWGMRRMAKRTNFVTFAAWTERLRSGVQRRWFWPGIGGDEQNVRGQKASLEALPRVERLPDVIDRAAAWPTFP